MSARPRRRQLERRETGRGVRDESSCNRSAALRTSACLAKQGATDGTSDNEGEGGTAPASFTAPIEISTAIAIKNANTGLSRTAAATTENLAQLGNRPMAGPQVVATWAILGVGWSIDGL